MSHSPRRVPALVAAYAVSSCGNYLNLVALGLFSYQVAGSGFGLGLLMALRLGCGFLAGLGAGALADRVGRRAMMIGADLAQASALAVLVVCAALSTPVWLLGLVVMVLGAGNTFFTVALRSAIPVIVGQDARVRVNGQLVTARSAAMVAGFGCAAPVIGFAGYGAAFALNAVSFLVSAGTLLLLRLRTDEERAPGRAAAGVGTAVRTAPETADGTAGEVSARRLALAALPPLLVGMMLLRGADALASSSHNVALPVVSEVRSPRTPRCS